MMSIHDQTGGHKYLTEDERRRFLAAAAAAPCEVRVFCHTLAWTGCRISEALALTADRVDVADATITVGLAGDPNGPLFRTIGRGTGQLTRTPLPQANAYAMIRRRAAGAGIATKVGNHSFRATGITPISRTAARWRTPPRWPTTPAPAPRSSTIGGAMRSVSMRLSGSGC